MNKYFINLLSISNIKIDDDKIEKLMIFLNLLVQKINRLILQL